MKKITFWLILFLLIPVNLWATPRTVTITYDMSVTEEVTSYAVYYDTNVSMDNKILISDFTSPIKNPDNSFSITCNNVNLDDNKMYYFSIEAVLANNNKLTSPPYKTLYKPIAPEAIKDFKPEAK